MLIENFIFFNQNNDMFFFFTYSINDSFFLNLEHLEYTVHENTCHKCLPKINFIFLQIFGEFSEEQRPLYNFYNSFF